MGFLLGRRRVKNSKLNVDVFRGPGPDPTMDLQRNALILQDDPVMSLYIFHSNKAFTRQQLGRNPSRQFQTHAEGKDGKSQECFVTL